MNEINTGVSATVPRTFRFATRASCAVRSGRRAFHDLPIAELALYLAVGAVIGEPVSTYEFPAQGENTGNSSGSVSDRAVWLPICLCFCQRS